MEVIDKASALITHIDDDGNQIIVDEDYKVKLKQADEERWRWIGTLFEDPRYNGQLTFGKNEDDEAIFRKTFAWSIPYAVLKVPDIRAISIQTKRYEYYINRQLALTHHDILTFKGSGTERKAYIPLKYFSIRGMDKMRQALCNILHGEWLFYLDKEFEKPYMQKLSKAVQEERKKHVVYPASENVFRAYNLTPLSSVKVVILGQDPYHTPGVADGLAFSSGKSGYCPPSLKNIIKELQNQYGYVHMKSNYSLQSWAYEGVLLLNTALTVREGEAGSHSKLGWNKFIAATIQALNKQDRPIVYLLWGEKAKKYGELIKNKKHVSLISAHPSPLSADKGFFGNNHFRDANKYLIQNNIREIFWTKI